MTKDDIIRMALEAGFEKYHLTSLSGESELDRTLQVGEYPVGEYVSKFAELVAAAERDECAYIADQGFRRAAEGDEIADLIRARGQQ